MRHLLTLLATLLLCSAPAQAQTIKTLGFNTTNGQVVANTGTNVLTFTNALSFGTNAATTRDNLGLGETAILRFADIYADNIEAGIGTNSVAFGALGIDFAGVSAATTRTNLGLGETDAPNFESVSVGGDFRVTDGTNNFAVIAFDEAFFDVGVAIASSLGLTFSGTNAATAAATTRTNLGIPLLALTQTSNVLMMRSLAGSTNTNAPFSGSVSVVGTNNTNTLVFTNGILLEVQ
jgi:hypothetical protein